MWKRPSTLKANPLSVLRPLAKHLPFPEQVVPWLESQLAPYTYQLKVTRPRKTKLGDFRPPQQGRVPTITLNGNLPPYQFLVTLVHELAHLITWEQHGRRAAPHGKEWKHCFGDLLHSLLAAAQWPPLFVAAAGRHAARPKSTTAGDPDLQRALLELDQVDGMQAALLLSDLQAGQCFLFKGRGFAVMEHRRTRTLVRELQTQNKYLIPMIAEVEVLKGE